MHRDSHNGLEVTTQPRITVIIPAHNARQTIVRALESVISQTLQPAEIIVIDDCSADDTVSAVREFPHRLGTDFLKVIALKSNHGPSYARNAGWELASGQFLAFLDADDAWHPRKLEIQSDFMLEHSELVLTGHRCLCLSEHDAVPILPETRNVKFISPWQLLMFSCSLYTPSVMVKREIEYRFDPSKHYLEDRLLWLQIVLNGHKTARLELPLAYMYKAPYGEMGLSSDLWEMEKGELDIFLQLRQMGFLNRSQEILLKGWSLLKYLRRAWVCRRRSHVP